MPDASRRLLVACVTATCCLLAVPRLGDLRAVLSGSAELTRWLDTSSDPAFWRTSWWVCAVVFFYALVPFAVIRLVLREPASAFGLRAFGRRRDWRFALLLAAFILPVVLVVSGTAPFLATYPLYGPAHGVGLTFWIWEALYLLQIIAVEVFFRGFLVHALAPRLGLAAALVATVPYVLVHLGKPPLECAASLGTGLLLGWLSLRSGSVWPGAAVHVAAALLMDVAVLWRKGLL